MVLRAPPLEGAFADEISSGQADVDNKQGGVAGNVWIDHGAYEDSDAADNASDESEIQGSGWDDEDYSDYSEDDSGGMSTLEPYQTIDCDALIAEGASVIEVQECLLKAEAAQGGPEDAQQSESEGDPEIEYFEFSEMEIVVDASEDDPEIEYAEFPEMEIVVDSPSKSKGKKKPVVVDPVKGKYEDNKILNDARRRGIKALLSFYGKVDDQATVDRLFGAFQFARVVKYNIDVSTPEGKLYALVSIPARFFDLIENNHPFLKAPTQQTQGSSLKKSIAVEPKLIFPKEIPYVLNITYGELYDSLTTARQAFIHYQVEMMKSGVEAITKGYSGPLVLASTEEPSEYSRIEEWWTSFRQFLKHNSHIYTPQNFPEECDESILDPSDPSPDDNIEIAFDENFKILYVSYNNFPMTAGLDCYNSEFGFKHARTNNYVHLIKKIMDSRLLKTWTDWVLTYTYPSPEIVPASKKTAREKQQENAEKTIRASSVSSVKTDSELEKENAAFSDPDFKLGVSNKTKTELVSVMDPVLESLPEISNKLSDTNVAYQYLLNKIGTDKMVASVLKCAYQGLVTIEDLAAQLGITALAEEAKTDPEKKKVLLGLLAELPEPCVEKVINAAFEIEKKDKKISIQPVDSSDTEEALSSIEDLEKCKEKEFLGQEVIIKPEFKNDAQTKHVYKKPLSKGNNVVIWQNTLVSLRKEFEEIDKETGEKITNQGSKVALPPTFAIDGLYGPKTMAGTIKLLGKNSVSKADFERYTGISQNEQLTEVEDDNKVYLKPYYGYKNPPKPPAKPELKNVVKVWQECLNTFDIETIGKILKVDGLFGEKTAAATRAVLNKDTAEVTYAEFRTTCSCLKGPEAPPSEPEPPSPPNKFYCKPDGTAPTCEEIYGEFEKQLVKMARMQREGEDITEQKKKVRAYENQYIMCMEVEQGLSPIPGDPTQEELIERMAKNSALSDPECEALEKAYIDSLGGFVVTTGSLNKETVYGVETPLWPGDAEATQEQKEAKSNWEICVQEKKKEKIIALQNSFEKSGMLVDKDEYPYPFTESEAASIIKTQGGGLEGTSDEASAKLNGVTQALKN